MSGSALAAGVCEKNVDFYDRRLAPCRSVRYKVDAIGLAPCRSIRYKVDAIGLSPTENDQSRNPSRECGGSNILNQQEHHRKQTFKDEYIEFLRRHEIPIENLSLFAAEYHGALLPPLRGCVNWHREFQSMEVSIERSFTVAFCSAKEAEKRYLCEANATLISRTMLRRRWIESPETAARVVACAHFLAQERVSKCPLDKKESVELHSYKVKSPIRTTADKNPPPQPTRRKPQIPKRT